MDKGNVGHLDLNEPAEVIGEWLIVKFSVIDNGHDNELKSIRTAAEELIQEVAKTCNKRKCERHDITGGKLCYACPFGDIKAASDKLKSAIEGGKG